MLHVYRYYTTEFDWNQDVVSMKQHTPLSKFDKWWMSKCMCIEGNTSLYPMLLSGLLSVVDFFIEVMSGACTLTANY